MIFRFPPHATSFQYLCELSLVLHEFVNVEASLIASAALSFALEATGEEWVRACHHHHHHHDIPLICPSPPPPLQNDKLQAWTGFSSSHPDLQVCKRRLIKAFYLAKREPVLRSVAQKYATERFSGISGFGR